MALDFYDINDTRFKQRLFGFSEQDIEVLDEALSELKRVSGVVIDPYKTSRIQSAHIKLLASYIKKSIDEINKKEILKISRLNKIYAYLINVRDGFITVGD